MHKRFLAFLLLTILLILPNAHAQELPLCADLAGDYIARDREPAGVRELASYLYASTILTAAPYTDYSRTRLTLYSTTITSPIIAQGEHLSYYQVIQQQSPYVFLDEWGNTVTFQVDPDGRCTGFDLEGEAYVPITPDRTAGFINATLWLLQALCFAGPAALALVALAWAMARRRNWRSFAVTHLNTALCACVSAAAINTFYLLAFAVPQQAYAQYQPLLWLNAALMASLAALPVSMALTWRRGELVLRQKLCYAGDIAVALTLLALMAVWQLYR